MNNRFIEFETTDNEKGLINMDVYQLNGISENEDGTYILHIKEPYGGKCRITVKNSFEDLTKQILSSNNSKLLEEFASRVEMEFYKEFDEIIPSVMSDKIYDIAKELAEDIERR